MDTNGQDDGSKRPASASLETPFYRPLDVDEVRKIREQVREFFHDRRLQSLKYAAEQNHELKKAALNRSADYGKIFVRTAFLLNGGAIVALMALMGSFFAKSDQQILVAISFAKQCAPAFFAYAIGLVLIALVAAIGFFNWMYVSHDYPDEIEIFSLLTEQSTPSPKTNAAKINGTYRFAVFLAFASLACFLLGSWWVNGALKVLGVS